MGRSSGPLAAATHRAFEHAVREALSAERDQLAALQRLERELPQVLETARLPIAQPLDDLRTRATLAAAMSTVFERLHAELDTNQPIPPVTRGQTSNV